MAKSIMVTGGTGMIGSNLVKRLVNDGWDVYVADNVYPIKQVDVFWSSVGRLNHAA